MANHKGSEGTIKVGSSAISEIRSWSLDHSADTIEDTSMGDASRTRQAGLKSWSGSVECYWDETDTDGQQALDAGSEVTLNLYPEGATSADTYFTGSALVTSVSRSGSLDGMVEATFSFEGNGDLTESTVA